jgi:hypothetical protein
MKKKRKRKKKKKEKEKKNEDADKQRLVKRLDRYEQTERLKTTHRSVS